MEKKCTRSNKSNEWNKQIIDKLFYNFDAEEIYKIKLPPKPREDILAWNYEKNGTFMVRSAYQLGVSLQGGSSEGSSKNLSNGRESLWNLVWKAKVPHKVRIFTWRAATDSLPTKDNKHKRTLELDGICNLCGAAVENAHHATVVCTKQRALCEEMSKLWKLPEDRSIMPFSPDWLLQSLSICPGETKEKFMLVLWRAWHLRDDVVHNKGVATIRDSVMFLRNYWACLSTPNPVANDVKGKQKLHEVQSASLPPHVDVVSWIKPPENHIKINVDASFMAATGLAALGAVGRDCFGDIVFSAGCRFHGCSDAEEAEVQALSFGLNQARKLNLNKVQMETDCIAVVAAVNDSNVSRASWWACYENSKDMIKEFGACSVSKVHRESNVAAHELAAYARVNGDFFLLADVPQALKHVIASDCNPGLLI